ncbi:MAG: acetate--CoA ligase family protein, partial [Alphaproteobacteria bacterium]|nr:acetate--CoA ligase family protein [Alphaproteobacteria bacterium]
MRGLGIETIETTVLQAGEPIPAGLSYPIAAKVLSADVPHKTEAGGVVLNINDGPALGQALDRIKAAVLFTHPEAEIDGISVQPMARGLAEALIGLTRDVEVGAVVTLAVGGVMAEI